MRMTEPEPADGAIRFANGRWEIYNCNIKAWIPIEGPASGPIAPQVELHESGRVFKHHRNE